MGLRRLFILMTLIALLCYLAAAVVLGQTATSTLSGAVRDEAGGAIPGVTITVSNSATGAQRTTRTDAQGRYFMVNLDPGMYEVRADASGYNAAIHNRVVMTVGGATALD